MFFYRNGGPTGLNTFLAVGTPSFQAGNQRNIVTTSADGINWTEYEMAGTVGGATPYWWQSSFSEQQVVAVGAGTDTSPYGVAYSGNAQNWTIGSGANNIPNMVTYGNGMYVATRAGSSLTTITTTNSLNGSNWSNGGILPTTTTNWRSLSYGNGRYIAIASGVSGSTVAAYSDDGINWTATTMPQNRTWWASTYAAGKFVAVSYDGYSAYSTDGISWTLGTGGTLKAVSVAYGNGKFIALRSETSTNLSNAIITSTNGINWTAGTIPAGSWKSIVYGNGIWVISGWNPASVSTLGTKGLYSTDNGVTWTEMLMPYGYDWLNVNYG